MIVKPQHFAKPKARLDIEAGVAKAVDFGARGVGLARGVVLGLVGLPPLFAGLAAGLFGNFPMLLLSGGFGVFALWMAKRYITEALAPRATESL